MKTCTKCGISKDESCFKVRVGRGTLMSWCSECEKARNHKHNISDTHLCACRRYSKTPAGIEANHRACKKYRQTIKFRTAVEKSRIKYPEKRAAGIILTNAMAAGKIHRPEKCSACGKQCKPEAHHYDYSRPLDVIWACHSCHVAYHWSS